jgi:hypothetical protein
VKRLFNLKRRHINLPLKKYANNVFLLAFFLFSGIENCVPERWEEKVSQPLISGKEGPTKIPPLKVLRYFFIVG